MDQISIFDHGRIAAHSTNMLMKFSSIHVAQMKKPKYQYLNVYDGKICDESIINPINLNEEPFELRGS